MTTPPSRSKWWPATFSHPSGLSTPGNIIQSRLKTRKLLWVAARHLVTTRIPHSTSTDLTWNLALKTSSRWVFTRRKTNFHLLLTKKSLLRSNKSSKRVSIRIQPLSTFSTWWSKIVSPTSSDYHRHLRHSRSSLIARILKTVARLMTGKTPVVHLAPRQNGKVLMRSLKCKTSEELSKYWGIRVIDSQTARKDWKLKVWIGNGVFQTTRRLLRCKG